MERIPSSPELSGHLLLLRSIEEVFDKQYNALFAQLKITDEQIANPDEYEKVCKVLSPFEDDNDRLIGWLTNEKQRYIPSSTLIPGSLINLTGIDTIYYEPEARVVPNKCSIRDELTYPVKRIELDKITTNGKKEAMVVILTPDSPPALLYQADITRASIYTKIYSTHGSIQAVRKAFGDEAIEFLDESQCTELAVMLTDKQVNWTVATSQEY